MNVKSVVRMLSILVVAVVFLVGGVWAVAAESPQTWQVLPGKEAGSLVYLQLAYPGDKADLRIQVYWAPFDPSYCRQLGFNVYGPNDFEGRGVQQAGCFHQFSYRQEDPAKLVVQVYNYSTQAVSYRVVVAGLEAAAAETVPSATVVESPAMVLETTTSGTLVGNEGGAYTRYLLAHPGDGEDTTVTMTLAPADPSFAGAFGFELYDAGGEHLATGVPTGPLGVVEATFALDTAQNVTVQVFNYSDGALLSYTLRISR